jgi:cobyric acid synthase
MGRIGACRSEKPFLEQRGDSSGGPQHEGMSLHGGRLFGTSVHGIFDQGPFRRWWVNRLRQQKGWPLLPEAQHLSLDARLDRLAGLVERHLDIAMLEHLIEAGV